MKMAATLNYQLFKLKLKIQKGQIQFHLLLKVQNLIFLTNHFYNLQIDEFKRSLYD